MSKKNLRMALAAAAAMLVLILDGKTALEGTSEGLSVCIRTLIPSLFPFFLLSSLLTGALSGQAIPILKPVAKLCRIPSGAESLLAIGLLGGYPIGAQGVALMHRAGQLRNPQAARMITFCNNAGPAFIFGILSGKFTSPAAPWLLWAIHICSAIFVGILLPGDLQGQHVSSSCRHLSLTELMTQALRAMALVCGWVIIMRMVLTFLDRWFLWMLPTPAQVAASGILELSKGCIQLLRIDCEGLRFIIAAGLLAFGGICVTLQTASVTSGISMALYFPGKVLQSSVSILLAYLMQLAFPPEARYHSPALLSVAAIVLIGAVLALLYHKKSSGIPAIIGV